MSARAPAPVPDLVTLEKPEEKPVPTSRMARTARFGGLVAGQGARWAGMRAANAFRSDERADVAQAQRAAATASELVARLGEMKGAAMKIGQVLSTVDFELIPEGEREQFKEKLAELRDDAPRVPFAKQRRLMESELDGRLSDVFAAFDETPIAAASIGQVYRAPCASPAAAGRSYCAGRSRRPPRSRGTAP